LLEQAPAWPEQPAKMAGDKAYSAGWLREWLQERGIEPVIAHQKKEKGRRGKFDKKTYRRRNIIERCISSLKWFRRVATRYEKLATHYLGGVTEQQRGEGGGQAPRRGTGGRLGWQTLEAARQHRPASKRLKRTQPACWSATGRRSHSRHSLAVSVSQRTSPNMVTRSNCTAR